jgi:large subunit ribosomal protein L21
VYAVIATGGKQYKVAQGDLLTIEKLDGDVGALVTFPTLMVADDGAVTVGEALEGRTVSATITEHKRGEYIRVFTYKNKTRQRKRRGHRQHLTIVKIDAI